MLNFGNKEFRNLQEQVYKNMRDIGDIKTGSMVLDEFGIKVVGQEATIADMPTVDAYKANNPDWEYGDAFAIGTEEPYDLYILTRANDTHADDYWFNIGEFPAPGPQGPQGEQGPQGVQGQTGATGQDGTPAGFGLVTATATTLAAGEDATVSVTTSGSNTEKNFAFTFGIPKGEDGETPTVEWGDISGTLTDQTDLVNALSNKQNTLVSGTNIKTINNESILGSGNIDIQSGGDVTDVEVNGTSVVNAQGVAEVTVPVDVSDLNNDAGYITSSALSGYATETWVGQQGYAEAADLATVATTGSYTDLIDKPTIPSKTSDLTNDSGYITGVAWGSITGTLSNQTDLNNALGGKQDTISDLATIRSGAEAGATAVQPAAISDMATETWVGQQGYLTSVSWSDVSNKPTFATVATSGDYDDLTNKPTIPTVDYPVTDVTVGGTSVVNNKVAVIPALFDGDYDSLTNKPDLSIYAESSDLATVATTGDYDDLTNKPTIPTATSQLTNDSGFITSSAIPTNYVTTNTNQTITGVKTFSQTINATSGLVSQNGEIFGNKVKANSLNIYTLLSHTGWFDDEKISGEDTDYDLELYGNGFKIVDYEDVDDNAPYYIGLPKKDGIIALTSDIPTVNNATLTIQKNGTTVDTFTANAYVNKTINITVPTNSDYVDLTSAQTITGVKTWDYDGDNTIEINPGSQGVGPKIEIDSNSSNTKIYNGLIRFTNSNRDQIDYTTNAIYITPNGSSQYAVNLPSSAGTLALTSDIPINYVTTDTTQTITGVKTFQANSNSAIKVKQGSSATRVGISLTNTSGSEYGFFQYNGSTGYTVFGASYQGDANNKLAFRYFGSGSNNQYNVIMPGTEKYTALGAGDLNLPLAVQVGSSGTPITASASGVITLPDYPACTYQTTEPTAAATDGGVHIVYLSAEPTTKYAGYIYMIAEN